VNFAAELDARIVFATSAARGRLPGRTGVSAPVDGRNGQRPACAGRSARGRRRGQCGRRRREPSMSDECSVSDGTPLRQSFGADSTRRAPPPRSEPPARDGKRSAGLAAGSDLSSPGLRRLPSAEIRAAPRGKWGPPCMVVRRVAHDA
jgi:hypothetical protein